MNATSQLIAVFVVLALLGAMAAGGYLAVDYIAAVFLSMDPQLARVTGVVAAALVLAAVLVAKSIRTASSQRRADQRRADQSAAYRLFLDIWTSVLQEPAGRGPGATRSSDALRRLGQSLVLYGSPAVINAHTALCALWEDGVQRPEIRSQFAKVLLEVRKDLGSDSRGLTADELVNLLFPTDGESGNSAHRDGSRLQTGSMRRSAEAS